MSPATSEDTEKALANQMLEMRSVVISPDLDHATFKRLLQMAQDGGPAAADEFFNRFLQSFD